MVKLYNTLTRKKETFKPLKGNTVRLYTCGPTVYNYAHIGNLRSYVFADTLKRILQYFNYRVKHVINITDVGHLTSDADAGDDKMLLGAARERKTVWQIAEFYTDAFKENCTDLNIIPPKVWCKATDHIYYQIKLIQKLERKGYTYSAGGNVYFDTSKFSGYGSLAWSEKKMGTSVARVEKDQNKKNQHDFVLWFTKSKFQDQDMKWESPWGIGYPGWHIECSAMSTHYLGQPFDIHTGGIDHITVHHTNEIAQSEAATGKPMARFWIHGEFLIIDAKRMGKSEGNFITLSTLVKRGYDPIAYRFFLLQTHYRRPLEFTWQSMDAAQNGYRSLRENIREYFFRATHTAARKASSSIEPLIASTSKKIDAALSDDLNTPQALAALFDFISQVNRKANRLGRADYRAVCTFVKKIDSVFGLSLTKADDSIPIVVMSLVDKREQARKEKQWAESDALREEIARLRYRVDDMPEGPRIVKI